MCGFSRRFDASYRDAFEKVDSGMIGRPSIIRSQTCDKHDPGGFFVEYAKFSGGCFVDMSGPFPLVPDIQKLTTLLCSPRY